MITEATRPCICYINEFLLTRTRVLETSLVDDGLSLKNFSEVHQNNLLLSFFFCRFFKIKHGENGKRLSTVMIILAISVMQQTCKQFYQGLERQLKSIKFLLHSLST